jgi:beta-phosphoglucomutase
MGTTYAVIFDMDGVLVDTYHAHFESWQETARTEGLSPLSEAEFAPTFGRTNAEVIPGFWGNRRFNDAQIAALADRKEAAFRAIIAAHFPAMPGAGRLLAELHGAGFRLAVGSSAPPENVAVVLDMLQAKQLFQAVVSGADVTRGKPDPEVFLLAAKGLGVPASRCVVIEDSPAGVAAAAAGGMASVGLVSTGRTPEALAKADLTVRSLCEVSPAVLRGLIDARG